ncbi:hypothetical protein K469DRAFT_683172 [Zopfia rhizophila CBS 207.26]|uniref:Uncharacterized protein n=1 Tax=Zopfia rhizophila CBS 207.26 TaxID=1314779 RepID=A0A6A6EI37_9PEZI|nr:hypothetical protein K469DRAFT_683172 [Zopfia rhizophila CBS 207.26]
MAQPQILNLVVIWIHWITWTTLRFSLCNRDRVPTLHIALVLRTCHPELDKDRIVKFDGVMVKDHKTNTYSKFILCGSWYRGISDNFNIIRAHQQCVHRIDYPEEVQQCYDCHRVFMHIEGREQHISER